MSRFNVVKLPFTAAAAVAMGIACLIAASPVASATTIGYSCLTRQHSTLNTCGRHYRLNPTDSLDVGGGYSLRMDPHGYLLLLRYGSKHCWQSRNFRTPVAGSHAIYQDDGNFVIYPDGSNVATWASNTAGTGGTTVNINPQGQLWVGLRSIFSNPNHC